MANDVRYRASNSDRIVCRILNVRGTEYLSKPKLIEFIVVLIEQIFYENPDHRIFKIFKEEELTALRLNRVKLIGDRIAACKKPKTK
jgi:hypothetical protein